MSIIASKKSLSSIGSLPVIQSPPNSPTTCNVRGSASPESSGMNAEQKTGDDDRSQNKTPVGEEIKLSEGSHKNYYFQNKENSEEELIINRFIY